MRIALLATLCLTLFAANSLFCRAALVAHALPPWQYTVTRGLSAAAMLVLLALCHLPPKHRFDVFQRALAESSWKASLSLLGYMACFSLSYVNMQAAMGTLIFNACIQIAMLGYGLWHGARLNPWQICGLAIVVAGLLWLCLPQVEGAPPLDATLFAVGVGLFWGAYTLCGRKAHDAILATAGNFFRCVPILVVIGLASFTTNPAADPMGLVHALCAGALATALGYVLWYRVVPKMSLVNGSIIQLAVPIITAILAVFTLNEPITWHLTLSSGCILGGIALCILSGHPKDLPKST